MAATASRRLLTVADVAGMLAVDPATVKRWAASGRLPSLKIGGVRRFDPDVVDAFVQGGEEDAAAAVSLPAGAADPLAEMAKLIGLSPRAAALRPDLAARFEVVPAGEHVARFAETYCRHTQLVPGGPDLGSPFRLELFQREWLDEGLEVDAAGRRVYSTLGLIEPRKNGKTSGTGVLSLYMASPADGEHRPKVIQAAGSKGQAGELFDQTTAFVDDPLYGSSLLRALFLPLRSVISCPAVGGEIERVAGDGDLNHSLNPHVVAADELHVWKTPKQRENWKALTSAQGARTDPLVVFLTTEGEGDDNVLAETLERVQKDPATEIEARHVGLTVFRNRPARMLIYRYAIAESATVGDLDAFVAANPAPWRTRDRLARDLADPMLDEQTKLRLYGNRRAQPERKWIATETWARLRDPAGDPADVEWIPSGSVVAAGGDAAITHDTTAIGWACPLEDGRVKVRARVWSVRERAAHHVFVPGGRLDNEDAEEFVSDELAARYGLRGVAVDPRYLATEARHLSAQGVVVVELTQSSAPMADAWQSFYRAVKEGRILHDGDPVLTAHVSAAVGRQTPRGWKVSKADEEKPIDALVAVVMAHWLAESELPLPWVAA